MKFPLLVVVQCHNLISSSEMFKLSMVSFGYRYNYSSSSGHLRHRWVYNVYFQDRIQCVITEDFRDLISTSYCRDMWRHIHSGYQMLPVKHTTLVAIGRIWKTLFLCLHVFLKGYCRVLLNLLKVTDFAYVVFYQHWHSFEPGIILEHLSFS